MSNPVRQEIPKLGSLEKLGFAVTPIVTGFGKAVGGRIKNRYPKGLRLTG